MHAVTHQRVILSYQSVISECNAMPIKIHDGLTVLQYSVSLLRCFESMML